ncbi:Cyclin-dependent kinase inhibitor 6-like [Zea mays]|uniref:Cyclin-dependent kinase inhibitor domain-containing protein n=1 Tax=Zea mays TaxID=4577 RepID=A0A804MNW1_MAIZE|nr:Cyclin-dependent kinase inhibitor 6-like [Zea mays]|eukprot:XP_008670241.1 cyclin-dependent kinase inhibitor 6 [Zea mays]
MAAATATAAVLGCSRLQSDIAGAGIPKKGKVGRSPPAEEVEAFLAAAERGMARRFAVKYNYDVVKDAPMDGGRYEWVRVRPG